MALFSTTARHRHPPLTYHHLARTRVFSNDPRIASLRTIFANAGTPYSRGTGRCAPMLLRRIPRFRKGTIWLPALRNLALRSLPTWTSVKAAMCSRRRAFSCRLVRAGDRADAPAARFVETRPLLPSLTSAPCAEVDAGAHWVFPRHSALKMDPVAARPVGLPTSRRCTSPRRLLLILCALDSSTRGNSLKWIVCGHCHRVHAARLGITGRAYRMGGRRRCCFGVLSRRFIGNDIAGARETLIERDAGAVPRPPPGARLFFAAPVLAWQQLETPRTFPDKVRYAFHWEASDGPSVTERRPH